MTFTIQASGTTIPAGSDPRQAVRALSEAAIRYGTASLHAGDGSAIAFTNRDAELAEVESKATK